MAADHWHISQIGVQAFKSFGPSLVSFDVPNPQLVGIVGPNGCGKSNLLEAICFATGGSPGTLRLTGRSLHDVTSTDAGSQRPEVHLHITRGRATHVLEACLNSDGTRSYKIDSRNKTATQVKDFLRERGIVVDSTTVIQQAAVTGLSDSNNAQALAQLVAGASGLSSWNQETAAARQEITRTHKALKDIQSNISKVQSSVAAENAAFKAAAEAALLEQQLEHQVQELMCGLQQRQQQLGQQLQERQQEEQRLEGANTACGDRLQQLASQRRALATQQAEVLAQLDTQTDRTPASGTTSTSSSLVQRIATTEAEVGSIQAAVGARADWASELEQKQQLLRQQEGRCQQLQQRLSNQQQETARLTANLAAAKSSTDAAAALQQQAEQAQVQASTASAAAQQQQDEVSAKQQDVQLAHGRVQQLQQLLQDAATAAVGTQPPHQHNTAAPTNPPAHPTTPAEADCAAASAAAAAAAAKSAAQTHIQQLQELQKQQIRLQMQMQAVERPLTPPATGNLLAQLGSRCRTVPLHACFRLRSAATLGLTPQQLEQLLTPLSVIAGPAVLQTLVAPTVQEANTLLAAAARGAGGSRGAGGRLKIWPLDNLSVQDMQQQQRAAQRQLGEQAVRLPLDLLEFDAVHRPVLLRAFGGLVIAADDATAATLIKQFGLPSVTLQGTVSRKGSMSGGWAGSSGSYAKTYWTNKHRRDESAQQLSACVQQLRVAETTAQQLQHERMSAEVQLAAAQHQQQLLHELHDAQAQAAAAAAALQQEQQLLQELEERSAGLQQRLLQYQAALGPHLTSSTGHGVAGRRGSQGGAAGRAASAVLVQQLQEEAREAAAAVKAAEQQLEEAQQQAEELSACIEALQVRLSGTKDPQQQQEALQSCLQALHQLKQQQEADAAAAHTLQEQLRGLQEEAAQLEEQVRAAEQQQKLSQKHLAQAAMSTKAAAAALQKAKQECKQLLQEFSRTDAVHTFNNNPQAAAAAAVSAPAGGQSSSPAPAAAACAQAAAVLTSAQLQQLIRSARQVQRKLLELDVPELLPGQKDALAARLGQVSEFNKQSDALKVAAGALEGAISGAAEQVYAANDIVYEDVAAGFSQLCSSLLPSLELQLVRTNSQAHEGLQFRFRRLQDKAAVPTASVDPSASAEDSSWHTNLGQLSGGQRTLVSLAMLLAVARTGGACGLLLLDEVDAALDEVNQARASALLHQLAHDRGSACQIMCVTHNYGFQESCDGFVRVTKSAAGHSVPAEKGASTGAAIAGAGRVQQKKGSRNGAKPSAGQRAAGIVAGEPRGAAEGPVSRKGGGGRAKRVRFAAS